MRTRALIPLTALLVALASTVAAAPSQAPSCLDGFTVAGDRATAVLHAAPWRLTDTADGVRLEMDGFRALAAPGRPALPTRKVLVALPPGARALEVRVLGARTVEVPGTHRLAPTPPFLPLTDPASQEARLREAQREWQLNHDLAYGSDTALPDSPAWLAGQGSLRKVAYAAVAYCPFTYHPLSGRLLHHSEVEIAIRFELPAAGSAEARHVETLLHDRVADGKAAQLFANYTEVADLYEPAGGPPTPRDGTYDYVIITTAGLAGAITASDFPAWKTSVGNSLRTVLTTDTEITSQPGADLAERIRNFLRTSYASWGIEHVLLVGDYATVPMRVCYPDPSYHVYNPGNPGLVAPGTPTDAYYADLSTPDAFSWDLDMDGYHGEYGEDAPDFLAEVAVGRIPVNDTARITYTLDKLADFDQDTGAWKGNALLAGSILFFENQNGGGGPFVDGASCLDSIGVALMGDMTVSRLTERAGLVTSLYSWPAISETAFNNTWRLGLHAVVNWSGHGWCNGAARTVWEWDDGDGVPESGNGELVSRYFINDATSNLDDDHPSLVFAISCNVGYPDPNPYGNLGIDLLTLPGWGSSAGIVSSSRPAAVSGDWRASPGGTEQICYEFNRFLLANGERVGDALYEGKFFANANYGWDHVYEYMNLYNFNLYGDPELALDRSAATGVPALAGAARPGALRLDPAVPNPFATATQLWFALPGAARVRAEVVDVGGRRVASLADRTYPAGTHALAWNGTDDRGRPLAAGVYFVVVRAGEEEAVRKVLRLR